MYVRPIGTFYIFFVCRCQFQTQKVDPQPNRRRDMQQRLSNTSYTLKRQFVKKLSHHLCPFASTIVSWYCENNKILVKVAVIPPINRKTTLLQNSTVAGSLRRVVICYARSGLEPGRHNRPGLASQGGIITTVVDHSQPSQRMSSFYSILAELLRARASSHTVKRLHF